MFAGKKPTKIWDFDGFYMSLPTKMWTQPTKT